MEALKDGILTFLESTGIGQYVTGHASWMGIIMIAIACVLCYLAIVKKFEPLLLLPIAIGMLLTNLPGAGMFHEEFFAGGHIQWDLIFGADVTKEIIVDIARDLAVFSEEISNDLVLFFENTLKFGAADVKYLSLTEIADKFEYILKNASAEQLYAFLENSGIIADTPILKTLNDNLGNSMSAGLIDILYLGVKLQIYPCLIFIGVGAMTDFGPLISNPKSLLLGAAAQIGIFATFAGVMGIGALGAKLNWEPIKFIMEEAASIGIIGGADGPTAIFVTSKLAPQLLGPIAVAAYSYMALVPVIQPPIMKLLTTKKERMIRMDSLRPASKTAKIIFPIVIIIFCAILVKDAVPLIGCLMLGNLLRECGVTERLSKTVQNEMMNIVTIFLGISVGATATAATFLSPKTLIIIVMGVVAFGVATAGGVLIAKLMNLFLPEGKKINPLIGSAGVSAVPMAARVSQKVGQEADPGNFLLMHAMGPNVAGVIGSAIAAGVLISLCG